MAFFLFFIAVALVGVTARLLIHAALLPRLRISMHLRQIEGYGFEEATSEADAGSGRKLDRVLAVAAGRLGAYALVRLPALKPLRRGELSAAAYYEITPEALHGYRLLAATLPSGLILFSMLAGGGVSIMKLVLAVVTGAAGWLIPALVIRSKGRKRLSHIDRELPELIDVLNATIEAGMGFAGSLTLVAGRFSGPLGEELRLTLQQQRLGSSNAEALGDMVERCDSPSMRAFVRTVTRGEAMGGSIGPILRELAADVRRRRRQAAEEKMQKAPVKMLFPLMFMIFPALILELMYPAAYSLLHSLGGH